MTTWCKGGIKSQYITLSLEQVIEGATTNDFRKANMDALIVKGGLEHFDIVALNFWGS
jgi:hypothetical protein